MEGWQLALILFIGSVIIGLLSWVLIKLTEHDKQLYRLVSDRESEKRSVASVHSDHEARIRALERKP